jgi:hypothetical protein
LQAHIPRVEVLDTSVLELSRCHKETAKIAIERSKEQRTKKKEQDCAGEAV